MEGAWSKLSDIWQYCHTKGDYVTGTRHAIQKKLQSLEAGKTIYEEVKRDDVKSDMNHVLVYHGENNVADSNVPDLVKKASQWESITRLVRGFTEEMLIIADLMYNVDYNFTRKLNRCLEEEGGGPVEHVSHALNRYKNPFISTKEKEVLFKALQKFFRSIGGDVPMSILVTQWTLCRDWQRKRVAFAHPLDVASLDMIKNKITHEPGFAAVREIALAMVNSIENGD